MTKAAAPTTSSSGYITNDAIVHKTILGVGLAAAVAVALGIIILERTSNKPTYLYDPSKVPPIGATTDCELAPTNPPVRVFTPEQLARYDGSDESLPLLLAVLGKVFDVTDGAEHYGKGSGYNCFVGKTNSRAFYSGEFKKIRDDVLDMSPEQVATVTSWEQFYLNHESYPEVGVVEGIYFDCGGNPTEVREGVLDKVKIVAQSARKEEAIVDAFPVCNMNSNAEETTIACDSNKNPFLLSWAEVPRGRCGCVEPAKAALFFEGNEEEQSSRPVQFEGLVMKVYPGCQPSSPTCTVERSHK